MKIFELILINYALNLFIAYSDKLKNKCLFRL